jgi:hypothetical protein
VQRGITGVVERVDVQAKIEKHRHRFDRAIRSGNDEANAIAADAAVTLSAAP